MSPIFQRVIATLAAVLLAGAIVGCEREATAPADQPDEPAMEQEEPTFPEEQPPAEEPDPQQQTMQDTREQISDDLEMPTGAVEFGQDVEQKITAAGDEFQRRAWGTVGTVESYLDRLDIAAFSDEEQAAYTDIESRTEQLRTVLDEMEQATGEAANELQGQAEEHLDQIRDSWGQLSDRLEPMYETPAGGGPMMEDDQMQDDMPMDDQQPMHDESETY